MINRRLPLPAEIRLCGTCGAHVPMANGALRCEDCGGRPVSQADLRRILTEATPSRSPWFPRRGVFNRGGAA